MFKTALMKGRVDHHRILPRHHQFSYPIAMVMFDVDELANTLKQSRWWSFNQFNFISFYRKDYLGRHNGDLKTAIESLIFQRLGEQFSGKVYLLTHPRYFGFVFNPVSFYFCVNNDDELEYILADINNTPWNERHAYVLKASQQNVSELTSEFDKKFHISPFMPMDIHYNWQFNWSSETLNILMQSYRGDEKQFTASMVLTAETLSPKAMNQLPFEFPLQTMRVVWRIYWHAFKLWLKKIPVFEHPKNNATRQQTTIRKTDEDRV